VLSSTASELALSQNSVNNILPSKLIDFSVSAKIEGEESQIAVVRLSPGETLRAESGAMLYMTKGVEMATSLQGVSSAFSRMMTGQNVFLTDFTYSQDEEGEVGLGTDFPSKIVRISLHDYGGSIIAQQGAYLASNPSVEIQMEFTKKFSTGFFGGQGFILQRLSGQGDVLVKAGGTLVEKELEEGEVLRVTCGSIVAFESTVEYDIQMLSGIKNIMFGGEGLFVTTLTGPGKIWLQGMPPDRMIAEIASRVPAGSGLGPVIFLGGSDGESTDGSGDGVGGDFGAAGVAGGAGNGPGEGLVTATDEAINADRQATVVSSGMTGDNETYIDLPGSIQTDGTSTDSSTVGYQETTFSDDGTSSSTYSEPTFDDGSSFSTIVDGSFSQQPSDDDFGDSGATEIFDTGAVEEAAEAKSIISTFWDFFSGSE
jgi:uncharacterized protein (TIGR00266 family)